MLMSGKPDRSSSSSCSLKMAISLVQLLTLEKYKYYNDSYYLLGIIS